MIPALFILGWIPRGLATATATAVLGPRPDSSMPKEDIVFAAGLVEAPARGRSGRHHRPSGVGAAFDT